MFNGEYILNDNGEEIQHIHVQLPEVRDQVNLMQDEIEYDDLLSNKINAAYDDIKDYTGHYFAKTLVKYVGYNIYSSELRFELSPLISVSSIRISSDGSFWTDLVEFTDFMVDKDVNGFNLIFSGNVDAEYIEFEFIVGYDEDELPSNARAAIVLKAGDMFDIERSGYAPQKVAILDTYMSLISGYVKTRIYDS